MMTSKAVLFDELINFLQPFEVWIDKGVVESYHVSQLRVEFS
jgi:hypothetical protein